MRPIVVAGVLVAVGASASFLFSRQRSIDLSPGHDLAASPARRLVMQPPSSAPSYAEGTESKVFAAPRGLGSDHGPTALERRIAVLESRLEEETAERKRLEEQLASLTTRLASSNEPGQPATVQVASVPPAPAPPNAQSTASNDPPPPQNSAPAAPPVDNSVSQMERALAAAGLDSETAADIKYRQDDLAMSEMYLRDQATRENWMDTPRFREEMAKIDAQRTSVRDEIGDDDAYDRYLFAIGQTNRVRVDDVLSESPAAGVGLQTGDMIIRYGDTRLFAPRDLVDQTHSGSPGEMVRLEVLRNGQRFEVEVPRGPLGLRVNAIQDVPPS